jgi:hypothetical protein
MEIIDKHFLRLPKNKQAFIMLIGTGYFIIGAFGYIFKLTNFMESFLFVVIGILYTEILKLQYRVESLELIKRNQKLNNL